MFNTDPISGRVPAPLKSDKRRGHKGTLLVVVVVVHLSGRKARRMRTPAGHAGLALWSFMMSTAHGAGLMLMPALIPLCIGNAPAREITASGSLMLALAAVGVHAAAMLAVTGVSRQDFAAASTPAPSCFNVSDESRAQRRIEDGAWPLQR